MARLSDMIRKGTVPDGDKSDKKKDYDSPPRKEDQVSLRGIEELKLTKESQGSQQDGNPESGCVNPKKEGIEDYAKLYKAAYDYVVKNGTIVKQDGNLDLKEGARIVSKMIKEPKGIEILYGKAITAREDMEVIASNMVNVAIYSIRLGIGLKYPKEKLLMLGTAGLLHDFGMYKVPDAILKKEGKLSDNDLTEIKKHPIHGYEMIKRLGNSYLWLAEVLLQEHERESGQGYPNGLKGEEIREYTKIISLADVFEGLTHKRPQRKRMLPYDATKKILSEAKGLYAINIVKVLLQKLGCFPLESYIRLSSKAIAKVVDTNEKIPLRPIVELVFDPQGNRVAGGKLINLQQNTLVHIVESVYEEDLPQEK